MIAAAIAVGVIIQRLPEIAKWGVEKAFPGATAEFHSVQIRGTNELEVRNLVLKSRKDGEILLTLDQGRVIFEFEDIRRARIGEVRLVYPALHVSPRIIEALGAPAKGEPQTKPLPNWSLRRLVCDYAEIDVSGYGNERLNVSAKAAFDLRDLSPASLPDEVHEIVFWDVKTRLNPDEPFAVIDTLNLEFTFDGLLQKREIHKLTANGGRVTLGSALQNLTNGGAAAPGSAAQAWKIGKFDFDNILVTLDDGRPEISDITFVINPKLENIPLTQAASALGEEEQTVEVANIEIASPHDPLTKVLTVRSAFIRFTLAGILRKELESLAVLSPTIYVGQDLFWYMEDAQRRSTPDTPPVPGVPPEEGWMVKDVRIDYGKLVIGSGGRVEYGLPLTFRSRLKDVELDNLATLQIRASFQIPEQQYVFPDYQLEFASKEGRLQFSYPPESGKKNLVGTLYLDDIRWRQYRAGDAWMSVTFDRQGINGEFGARAYRGYFSGGFSFFFQSDSPWVGWIAGTGVDTKSLTDVIAPQNFSVTGPFNFKLQMDAIGKLIQRMKGDFKFTKTGKMTIGKMNDLMANIPPEWTAIKQSSTRIALETLRDFPYAEGRGSFWFVDSQGVLQLRLQGPTGSRKFDIVLHSDDSAAGQWKKRVPGRQLGKESSND